jgi:predicted secreted protein
MNLQPMSICRAAARIALASSLAYGCAFAQVVPAPQNVLQLSTTGTLEVQQDLLHLILSTTRDGTDPAAVQAQVKVALDAALAEARKAAQPGQLDVRTGNFGLFPRYSQGGRITGWQGSAELVLEGRDFPRITQTAAKIQTMTVAGVSFGLSREQRTKVEGEAQAVAIERFKEKAAELAKSFGFGGYSLREVAVNANDQGFIPRPRVMAMEAKAAQADMPVPVEAGRSTVVVTVSGSVQLR